MSNYTAKDIKSLEGIEAIRLRPGMYIGGKDANALHHLLLEVISNSVDEAINGHGKRIEIAIDSKSNTAEVRDFGRGIPFGKMDDGKEALVAIATDLHSGGKFGQQGYKVSGGLHGIGITAVNAVSESLIITSNRDRKTATGRFSRGKVIDMKVKDKLRNVPNGTTIRFTPDTQIFDDVKFNFETTKERVRLLSFLTSGVTFDLVFDDKHEVFYSEEGLKDLVKFNAPEPSTEIMYIKHVNSVYEVEIAFTYQDKGGEKIMAFTNNIPNPSGGTHVTGFKRALTTSLNRLGKKFELLGEKDGNLKGDMLRKGIVAAINIHMQESPDFEGQTKQKLVSPSATGRVSSSITQNIDSVLSRKDLNTIMEKALLEKKAEEAAQRRREAANKVVAGGKSLKMISDLPEKLADCTADGGELYLVEGNSAAGSANDARDNVNQAILGLRGKVLNTYGKELDEIIKNKEIKDILTALGCGIGDRFNIKNLRYDKIILLADADPDGGHINILIMTLFLMHLPEIVKAGKLYRAVPPFYKYKSGKSVKYLQDDAAKDAYIKRYGQPKDMTRFKGIGEMNPDELWDTTLDPKNRVLVQLTTEDLQTTLQLFDTLMGSKSSDRRSFIMEHAKEVF